MQLRTTIEYLAILASIGCSQSDSPQPAAGPTEAGKLEKQPAPQFNALRQLGLAMFTYADENRRGRLLPDELEWRVALGRATNSYEPNQLRDEHGKTRLLLVTGPGTLFDRDNPNWGTRRMVEQAPRPAATIPLIVMVGPDRAVGVDEPRDFVFDPSNPKAGLGEADDPFLVLMADGSVRELPRSISPAAFTVVCQIEPQVDAGTFGLIKHELERLGLPSLLPRQKASPNLE